MSKVQQGSKRCLLEFDPRIFTRIGRLGRRSSSLGGRRFGMTEIVTTETKSLGDRSYVVSDGEVAAVIDPQRDIDRVLAVVERLGVRITHVFETHVHNDYVTGGLALARRVGAAYVLSAAEDVDFDHVGVRDGDEVPVGRFVVIALHPPGHTPHHMSYVVGEGGRPCAVFTGGSMLYGTVGRTDLIADDQTEELTRAQFRSVRRLAAELPDDVAVQPPTDSGASARRPRQAAPTRAPLPSNERPTSRSPLTTKTASSTR